MMVRPKTCLPHTACPVPPPSGTVPTASGPASAGDRYVPRPAPGRPAPQGSTGASPTFRKASEWLGYGSLVAALGAAALGAAPVSIGLLVVGSFGFMGATLGR